MKRRFVRSTTDAERQALMRCVKESRDTRLVQRCHAVLWSADGMIIPRIAQLLQVDQSTVHRWLDGFESGGVEALPIQWSRGNPPRWDENYESTLVETVRHDPRWYGLEQSVWTCRLLAGYLRERTGIGMSAERVRVLLHQHGLRLKQPTAVVRSPDPLYDPKGSRRT